MRFEAEVRQVKTMVDSSVNVTFNLPEYQLAEAQQLLAMIGDMVRVDLTTGNNRDDERREGQISKGRKR